MWAVAGGGSAAVVVVVVALLLTGVIPLGAPAGPKVEVTAVTLSFSPASNPCFTSDYVNDSPSTQPAGGVFNFEAAITNDAQGAAEDCMIESLSTATPGFSVEAANVPLEVPASGSTELDVEVSTPSTAYTGPLNLTATATFVPPNVNVSHQNVVYSNPTQAGQCGAFSTIAFPFTGFGGGVYNDTVEFLILNAEDFCSITSLTVAPTSFPVLSTDLPIPLPVDSFATVTFTLGLPTAGYSGNLTLTFGFTIT